ncbi:transposase, partial [Streptomyces sp. ME01-18a]|uniref:transposase n=1 Tax=Streptomyces sp. ME01-18a TaxID=3028669 RepID=UPI0029BA7AA9
DSTAGRTLIEQIAAEHPTIRKTWVDGGYRQHLVEHAATLGIDMGIVRRDPTTRGFTVLPRHWTVERTLGWLMNHRRLARDYEAHAHRSEAMIHLAMIDRAHNTILLNAHRVFTRVPRGHLAFLVGELAVLWKTGGRGTTVR